MLLVELLLLLMRWGFAVEISLVVGCRWVGIAALVDFLWVSVVIGNLFAGTAGNLFVDQIVGLIVVVAKMLWSAC